MRIQTDTLKYAKLLKQEGFHPKSAEALMSTLTNIEIHNVYSIDEVDSMLSESIKEVFVEQDKKLAEQRREFDINFNELKNEFKESRQYMVSEMAANRRWTVATIITVGLSLATYLSALFHLNH